MEHNKVFFGTDGVRGKVGKNGITPEFFLHLGMASGRIFSSLTANPVVIIGKDTRISGQMLESALQAGFVSAGVDVIHAGCIPTPAVAYLTKSLRLTAGVVISASHNSYEDNGIKFFDKNGFKLPDHLEKKIESSLLESPICNDSSKLGVVNKLDDAIGRYVEFCKGTFSNKNGLDGLHIVVDASHGSSYQSIETVLVELGAKVSAIASEPNGLNINKNVGTNNPKNISSAVLELSGDFGVALDGDGDRLLMVDSKGTIFQGDELLFSIAKERIREKGLSSVQGIVGTLMSNFGLEKAINAKGLEFRRSRVGDRYISEMLRETGWEFGGENSGHILCMNHHTTGDGIINALQVLQALLNNDTTLCEWNEELKLMPQSLLNVPIKNCNEWYKKEEFMRAQERIKKTLGEDGRILVRPSGTEPLLRIMVEAKDRKTSLSFAKELAASLKK